MKCVECTKREADPKTGLCMYCSFENGFGDDFEEDWDSDSD